MAERRSLVEGVSHTAQKVQEEQFVFGQPRQPEPQATPVPPAQGGNLSGVARVPLTTRIRPELAATLKRVSLERQLGGVHPCAMQDLVEEALELWLLKNNPGSA